MEDQIFICEKCNYKTNIKRYYSYHCKTEIHKTGKRKPRKPRKDKLGIEYKCEICDYNTFNKNNYETHKLNNHSTREEREKQFKYYCKTCDFGVFVESCYNKHITTKKHLMRIK